MYSATITNDFGDYEVQNVKAGKYYEITADGYYFNEISGQLSNSKITLSVLSSGSNAYNNVNILTHLSKDRIKKLFSEGKSFEDAKKQSEIEFLKIFEIDTTVAANFENFDLSSNNNDNAILIAISSIFQGSRTEAELTQFMSEFISDFKDNGQIETIVKQKLVSGAALIDEIAVEENLRLRYAQLGSTVIVPEFHRYIYQFVDKNKEFLTYLLPAATISGENILIKNNGFIFKASPGVEGLGYYQLGGTFYFYSLAISTPQNKTYKVVLKSLEGKDSWMILKQSVQGWNISNYDSTAYKQVFTSNAAGEFNDAQLCFYKNGGKFSAELFEGENTTPIKSMIYSWK